METDLAAIGEAPQRKRRISASVRRDRQFHGPTAGKPTEHPLDGSNRIETRDEDPIRLGPMTGRAFEIGVE